MDMKFGPTMKISEQIDKEKYRGEGETFEQKVERIARGLCDGQEHYSNLYDSLLKMRFLPAGRVQTSVGSSREVTAYNCFVSGKIEDSLESILKRFTEAGFTMKSGGGIGYNFSHIRPSGDWIKSLESKSSGPISFMHIFSALCHCISSSGFRRGAQMAILNCDHPDIEAFIQAKQNQTELTGFNVSISITDKFMEHVKSGEPFPLQFEGKVYKTVDPQALWDKIMRATWDYAEPGCFFVDRINEMNNLYYCEDIEACNPCGEQSLPEYGCCNLASYNLTQYLVKIADNYEFDYEQFTDDVHTATRAMDNIMDRTIYPLPEQKVEALNKRRIGMGITGLANASEMMGMPYGSPEMIEFMETVLETLRDESYMASSLLAKEKGSFPLFDYEKYSKGKFFQTLSPSVQESIRLNGLRNSHLTSIAPTGTISLVANNISSGIEPPFSHFYDRTYRTFEGDEIQRVEDYAYSKGVKGRTADSISVDDHLNVLIVAQRYIDSAISKTCNVGPSVLFDEFKDLYMRAWEEGCKGVTTFRLNGKRFGVLNKVENEDSEKESMEACYIDPISGIRTCDA